MLLVAELTPAYCATILAGLLHGFVIIPIHAEIEQEGLVSILEKTTPDVIVVSKRVSMRVTDALEKSGLGVKTEDGRERLIVTVNGREVWPGEDGGNCSRFNVLTNQAQSSSQMTVAPN